ncbi:MAG: SCO family protein [Salinigranum sp.]
MDRRAYLRTLAAGGAATTVAGCVGSIGGGSGSPNTHLGEPKSQKADSADLPYPAWGQKLPAATLPDPLTGEDVTTTGFTGRKNVVLTCFYSHCPNVCQQMIGVMRNVQADASQNGYADDVEFLAITFDPERDTAERLKQYADEKNVDLGAGNWHFLRPKSVDRAKAVVTDTFGIKFQKTDAQGHAIGDGGTNGTAETGGANGSDASGGANGSDASGGANGNDASGGANGGTPSDGSDATPRQYFFRHIGLVFLVNTDGYVERAYQFAQSGNPPWQDRRDDLKRVIKREG